MIVLVVGANDDTLLARSKSNMVAVVVVVLYLLVLKVFSFFVCESELECIIDQTIE